MLAAYQDASWPPKETLGAHQYSRLQTIRQETTKGNARWSPKHHVANKSNAACAQRCQVLSITPCAHPDKCQMPTKKSAGHQIVMCPGKSTLGAQQDATCPPKQRLGPYQRLVLYKIHAGCPAKCQVAPKMPGAQQNIHWVPMKMLGGQINVTCPPKETLCAHKDSRWPQKNASCPPKENLGAHQNTMWPPKHHMPTRTSSGCPANEMPSAQQNARCPPIEMVGAKHDGW